MPLDVAQILEKIDGVEGWLTPGEAKLLAKAVTMMPQDNGAQVVEVGSYCGRSTIVLATALMQIQSSAMVVAVDPHEGEVSGETAKPSFSRFKKNVSAAGCMSSVLPCRMASYETNIGQPISLLFIDALHDYDNVSRDFYHFENCLVPEAVVAFHDYGSFPDVTMFVDQMASQPEYSVLTRTDSLILLARAKIPPCSENDPDQGQPRKKKAEISSASGPSASASSRRRAAAISGGRSSMSATRNFSSLAKTPSTHRSRSRKT